VDDDVDVWRYAIVSCMPETTTGRGLAPSTPTAPRPLLTEIVNTSLCGSGTIGSRQSAPF